MIIIDEISISVIIGYRFREIFIEPFKTNHPFRIRWLKILKNRPCVSGQIVDAAVASVMILPGLVSVKTDIDHLGLIIAVSGKIYEIIAYMLAASSAIDFYQVESPCGLVKFHLYMRGTILKLDLVKDFTDAALDEPFVCVLN